MVCDILKDSLIQKNNKKACSLNQILRSLKEKTDYKYVKVPKM